MAEELHSTFGITEQIKVFDQKCLFYVEQLINKSPTHSQIPTVVSMDVDHVEAGVGGTSQCQALSLVAVLVSRLPECLRRVVGETAHHGLTGRRLYVHARSEVFQSLNKTVHLDTVK